MKTRKAFLRRFAKKFYVSHQRMPEKRHSLYKSCFVKSHDISRGGKALTMTKEAFQSLIQGTPLFLDGATGSNLQKKGMPSGVCPEQWILEHPEALISLQQEFVAAGSRIVYAPTFTANRIKLREYGLEEKVQQMNRELVSLSKEAVGDRAYVAGDLTMTGEQLSPIGPLDFEELIDVYKEQIRCLVEAGADLLVVETMMSLQETRAAVIAAREVCDLAVMATLTFERDGRTLFGTDPATAAIVLEGLGVAAVGVNCSAGPDKMVELVRAMAEVTDLPVIAKPNAGLPALDKEGNTCYDMQPEAFGACMGALVAAGASVLGGCCGSTPAHIRAAVAAVGDSPLQPRARARKRFLTSERATVSFAPGDPFLVVGERINPTGKKKLQAQLLEGRMELVEEYAREQEACGAAVLDVNMGMGGIDEKAMMLKALEAVGGATNLPLSIDSSHVEVLEAALRRYPGRALINSVSLEKTIDGAQKADLLFPLAKKYGAMVILLPLSDKGLPEHMAERMENIEMLQEKAHAAGLSNEDLVVDGLVATVGANPAAALETLETIRHCYERGLATVCGLSNISFGLPERGFVNAAFLTMAIREGLTMAIANPSQELLMSCAFASDLLLHKKESAGRYIGLMEALQEKRAASGEAARQETGIRVAKKAQQEENLSVKERLYQDVLRGSRERIVEDTQKALEEGQGAQALLDEALLPAIGEVGELFDKGKYFLPQLIASAEAMKRAIEVLEPLLLQGGGQREMPTVVIATVEGDIHDIGKNLVALMLKNHGFQVIDLGKDVSGEKIVDAAKAHNAQIIALSALMTTTMQQMRKVIVRARQEGVSAKIIVGGAVITKEYAQEIGADGYSKDAAEAVRLVRRLLHL